MQETAVEAAQIIERLGGNAKTAALCEVTPGAVSQWLKNGIPRAQLKFLRLARPDVFDEQPSVPNRRSTDAPNFSGRRKDDPPSPKLDGL